METSNNLMSDILGKFSMISKDGKEKVLKFDGDNFITVSGTLKLSNLMELKILE